jgi:hypothetical protein
MESYKSSPGRRYGSTIRVLSYLSEAWCALGIIAVGALLMASCGGTILKTLAYPDATGPELAGELFGLGVACAFIVLASGLGLGRFVLRAVPLRYLEGAHRGWFDAIRAVLLCFCLGSVLVFAAGMFSLASGGDNATSNMTDQTQLAGFGMSAILAVLCVCCVAVLLVLHYRKPRGFLDRPFVLFLRRFSTFSDRAVIGLILNKAPSGVPVVFLTPIISRPADWDPFVVGFAGLKILRPWRSMPIVLRASNDEWQSAAEELIRRAQTILLDTSETSSAMRAECELINTTNRWSDTVCLRLFRDSQTCGDDLLGYVANARVIDYKKSWVRAIPRLVLGLVLIILTAEFFAAPLAILTPTSMRPLALILIWLIAISAYYSAFMRPSIDRKAKMSLKAVLHAAR